MQPNLVDATARKKLKVFNTLLFPSGVRCQKLCHLAALFLDSTNNFQNEKKNWIDWHVLKISLCVYYKSFHKKDNL